MSAGGYDFGPDRGRNPLVDLHAEIRRIRERLFALEVGRLLPIRVHTGTGNPEGSVEGDEGDFYIRPGGGSGSTFYVKVTGSGTTGWAAVA